MTALTIDFHNTLVECDAWFDLEVKTLITSVLTWSDANYGLPRRKVEPARADAAYRNLRQAIRHHGHELDATRSTMLVLERLGIDLPIEIVNEAIEALMRDVFASATPVPGAQELLRAVHEQGIPIAIVSIAIHHRFLEWALDQFGMSQFVQVIVTSASAGFSKSRPEIYWSALSALDRPASVTTHLGDSLRFDVGGAQMAGLGAIWFDRQGLGMNGDTQFRPALIVPSLQSGRDDIVEHLVSRR